jgi:hypothetical protein
MIPTNIIVFLRKHAGACFERVNSSTPISENLISPTPWYLVRELVAIKGNAIAIT